MPTPPKTKKRAAPARPRRTVRRALIPKDDCRDCEKAPEVKAVEYVIKHQILREKIFPEEKEIFLPDDVADIYVTRRVPSSYSLRGELDEFASGSSPSPSMSPYREGFEKRFYQEVWRLRREQIIFLVGNRGCGKSTFLEHFFRSDCPAECRSNGSEREYLAKLKVRVNLRSVEYAEFKDQFYKQANPTLIERYRRDRYGFSDIGEYHNFSALLAGPCDAHHRDLSPVANLFYASPAENVESNMLIGFHLLWLLDYWSETVVTARRTRTGVTAESSL